MPELADRTITPHVIRHTTVCHLVLASVDINTIRAWLGHVSISTTNIYAEIDLTLKANAVALCEVGQPRPGHSWKEDKELMVFLKSLRVRRYVTASSAEHSCSEWCWTRCMIAL